MRRTTFIKQCISLGSLFTLPVSLLAKSMPKFRVKKGFMVDAGKDRFEKSITLLEGDTFYTKISTKDSDGDIYVFESSRTKKGGPALHYHPDQDEWWYVLEGEFLIKVGEQAYRVKAGDSVFGPRGVPHTFAKTNEENGRLLMFYQPAGKMEEWFEMISEGKVAKMSEDEQDKQRRLHGLVRVGPALDYMKGY